MIAAFYFIDGGKNRSARNRVIGKFISVTGDVERRLPETTQRMPAKPGDNFRSGELLFTERASETEIEFENGVRLRIEPGSRFVTEIDRANPDVMNATIIEGSATTLFSGKSGMFRLFKEGREVPLSEDSRNPVPVVPVVVGSQPVAQPTASLNRESVVITASTPSQIKDASPTPQPQLKNLLEKKGVASSGTISNDEIRASLRAQTSFFQRCYLAYINRQGTGSGSIVVAFTINNTGKVSGGKILRSTFNDSTLNACVLEAVERASFRAFDGEPIPVLEFPIDLG